uniref:hypothetical protein n=1 Tax=Niallia taxi TaxID=2499688 RepID=UPI003F494A0D
MDKHILLYGNKDGKETMAIGVTENVDVYHLLKVTKEKVESLQTFKVHEDDLFKDEFVKAMNKLQFLVDYHNIG